MLLTCIRVKDLQIITFLRNVRKLKGILPRARLRLEALDVVSPHQTANLLVDIRKVHLFIRSFAIDCPILPWKEIEVPQKAVHFDEATDILA